MPVPERTSPVVGLAVANTLRGLFAVKDALKPGAREVVRQLARLYGGRPGTLGLIRLMRHVIAHLAVTGGMAASDCAS